MCRVSSLLGVTFARGLLIAVAHGLNKGFVAPAYDVALHLTAFASAVAASLLLGHRIPAVLCAVAIACRLVLARRTILVRRRATKALGPRDTQQWSLIQPDCGISVVLFSSLRVSSTFL